MSYNFTPEPPRPERVKQHFHGPKKFYSKFQAYSLEDRGYQITAYTGFSHWTRGVTFHEGFKKENTKVSFRLIEVYAIDADYQTCVDREIKILAKLSHKHIVRTFDFLTILPDQEHYYIIQEWLPENLGERVDRARDNPMTEADVPFGEFELLPSGLDTRTVKLWMGQIAQAIEYLHTKGYVHNRIEPNSIMIRSKRRAVLSHFLAASSYRGKGVNAVRLNKFMMAEPRYLSNDVIMGATGYNVTTDAEENDVWGFGCTCAFAMAGRDLFVTGSLEQTLMAHANAHELINGIGVSFEHRQFLNCFFELWGRLTRIQEVVRQNWFTVATEEGHPHPMSPAGDPSLAVDDARRLRSFNVLGAPIGDIYELMAAAGYAIGAVIGKGSYGAVYAGTNKVTYDGGGHVFVQVAVKMMGRFNKSWRRRLNFYPTELRVLSRLQHPNLVHVYDVFQEANTHGRNWERRVFIWMERSKCDLARMAHMNPDNRLPELVVSNYMAHALAGLEFLHEQNIAHRDLKPANILAFDTIDGPIAKITDFSLIRETDHNTITRSHVCTPGYKSPACIIGWYNPFKLDVFSMGISIFELLVGRKPNWKCDVFRNNQELYTEFGKLQNEINYFFADYPVIRRLLRDEMLTRVDGDRRTVKQVRINSWFPDVSALEMYHKEGAIRGFNDPVIPIN